MKYELILDTEVRINESHRIFNYDDELDDISSISADISDYFKASGVQFNLYLNDRSVPFEIWGDFPCFLDDFSCYIDFLFGSKESFTYELLGGGNEMLISMDSQNDQVLIDESRFVTQPYLVDKSALKVNAVLFMDSLNFVLGKGLPNLRFHPWYIEWDIGIRKLMFPTTDEAASG